METISVRCNHCGAPLDVGMQTRFVTCQFCNSQLEVKRTESSVFTEEITRIARNTDQMAQSLEVIKLQNEIEQLDREWSAQQADAAPSGKNGGPQTTGGAIFGLVFSVFFAIVCFSMAGFAGSMGGPGGMFSMVPIGMGIFALVAAVINLAKSSSLDQSRGDYQQRRDELMRRIAEMKRD
jgi:DNA-directed RNA polymerase subunit RPC12/RpoP